MPFIMNNKNGTLLIKLNGELDLVKAHEFRETVDKVMEEMEISNLLVDLTSVTFIDSSGLGVILGRFRKIKSARGGMALFGAMPNVLRILELSGIATFVPICATEAEAWKLIERSRIKEA
ncbi:MAG: anti-sigma factor antagonist [Peptococcia bacterium]